MFNTTPAVSTALVVPNAPAAPNMENELAPNEIRFGPDDAELHRRLRLNADKYWPSSTTPEHWPASDGEDSGEEVRHIFICT